VSEPRTAVVAGATGLVGGHVVDLLLAGAAYGGVTALVRRRHVHTFSEIRRLAERTR